MEHVSRLEETNYSTNNGGRSPRFLIWAGVLRAKKSFTPSRLLSLALLGLPSSQPELKSLSISLWRLSCTCIQFSISSCHGRRKIDVIKIKTTGVVFKSTAIFGWLGVSLDKNIRLTMQDVAHTFLLCSSILEAEERIDKTFYFTGGGSRVDAITIAKTTKERLTSVFKNCVWYGTTSCWTKACRKLDGFWLWFWGAWGNRGKWENTTCIVYSSHWLWGWDEMIFSLKGLWSDW